jgi:hypothetical protein
MPQIANTFANPDVSIGKSLEDLGNSMFGPQAAAAEYARQKATGTRRDNLSHDALAAALRANGGALDASNPDVAAAVAGLDDPRKFFQGWNGLAANRYGASDPRTTNSMLGAGEAYSSTPGGVAQALANARTIASIQAQKVLDAEKYKADTSPVNVITDNGPQIYSKSDAIARHLIPVLGNSEQTGVIKQRGFESGYKDYNDEQKKAADVYLAPDHVLNYASQGPDGQPLYGRTTDGKTDMTTGRPVPQSAIVINPANAGGTNAFGNVLAPGDTENRALRNSIANNEDLKQLIGHVQGLVKANPTIVGPTGVAQGLAQHGAALAQGVAQLLGKGQDLNTTLGDVKANLTAKFGSQAASIMPELFNPNIGEVQAAHTLLLYKGAEALAGQSGRDISDADVRKMREIFGDPNSLFENAPLLQSKLDFVSRIADANIASATSRLKGRDMTKNAGAIAPGSGAPVPIALPAAAPGTPAPAAAPAAPAVSNSGSDPIAEAKAAIAQGADATKVMARLQALIMGQQPAPAGP